MKHNYFLETIKAVNGVVYNITFHQQRYENVLRSFGVKKKEDLASLLFPPKNGIYRCRIVYSLDKIIEITYHPYIKREINSIKLIESDDIIYDKKYTNREKLNQLFSQKGDCDEVLIVKNNLLCDTTIANIALYKEKQWFTPKKPLLYGTTLMRYQDKLIFKDIGIKDLQEYSHIAFLNAMIDFDIKKIDISHNNIISLSPILNPSYLRIC